MREATAFLAVLICLVASGCANSDETLLPIEQYKCKPAVDAIKVDGVLDEKSWQEAESVPIKMEWRTWKVLESPAGYGRMCWDAENFYIAMEMPDSNIRAEGKDRDKGNIIEPNDVIEVFLDVNCDDHHFFELHVNPMNAFNDLFITRPPEGSLLWQRLRHGIMFMPEYNLKKYTTAVKVHGDLNHPEIKDEKWVVEMALPYSALMMPFDKDKRSPKAHPVAGDVWRVQLVVQNCDLPMRYYVWSPAYSTWHHHGIQRYGQVEFVGKAPPEQKPAE